MSRMCVAVQEVARAAICVNWISGRQGVTWPLCKDETRCLLQTPTKKSVRLEDKLLDTRRRQKKTGHFEITGEVCDAQE